MPNPEVRYCTTDDGVRIAYCVEGEGPPLVHVPSFVDSFVARMGRPAQREFTERVAEGYTSVYFDHRATGLSQREVADISLEAHVSDIDAVVRVLEQRKVSVFTSAIGGPVSLAYSGLHADKVGYLVLSETFPVITDVMTVEQMRAFAELCRTNWSVAARTFADLAGREYYADFAFDLGKAFEEGTSGEHMARLIESSLEWDGSAYFSSIKATTLILHREGDSVFPFSAAQKMAAGIRGARLVPLKGASSLTTQGDVAPAIEAVRGFLPKGRRRAPSSSGVDMQDRPQTTMSAPAVQPQSFSSGRYVVSRLLGEGGQKIVFLARDTQLGREVAVALLKAEGLEEAGLARLRREAQALARLEAQPNIVAIYDIGEHEGRPFTVCEYLAGGTVEQELARAGGPLPAERAVAIARDVCHALVVAHGGDIIHRDIKPSNIWLTAAGSAKLGDFGLATALDRSRVTQAGTVMGTAAYMAPEQALGGEIDQRSDVYSLGCVLYEMLTGRPPFVADTAIAVASQHVNAAVVPPADLQPGLPRALERLVMQMLAKSQEDRPQTAAAVLATLEGNEAPLDALPTTKSAAMTAPQIRYCTTEDGVSIAYCTEGQGPPLIWCAEPQSSHLQLERSLKWTSVYSSLTGSFQVVRFDARGVGMSDHDVADLSLDARVLDVEAVASALKLKSFALVGGALAGTVAMRFVSKHPDHVTRLVLYDSVPLVADWFAAPQIQAVAGLLDQDWEMFTENVGTVIFGWEEGEARQYGSFLRSAATPDQVRRYISALATDDATAAIEHLRLPVLVIYHSALTYIGLDRVRDLVSSLPDARLLVLEGHYLDDMERMADQIATFLSDHE